MNKFYRYVTPSCIAAYEALGWLDLGPTVGHHGTFSNTLVFNGDCETPPEPEHPIPYNPAATSSAAFANTADEG